MITAIFQNNLRFFNRQREETDRKNEKQKTYNPWNNSRCKKECDEGANDDYGIENIPQVSAVRPRMENYS